MEIDSLKNKSNDSAVVAKIDVSSHEEQSTGKGGLTARVAPSNSDPTLNGGVAVNMKGNEVVIDVNNSEKISDNSDSKVLKTGKLLTLIYPNNEHCAWISLPDFDPSKMPKILSHQQLALQPSVYVDVMKAITGDIRFVGYCALYSRVLPIWILLSVIVLLIVLFSSPSGGLPIVILVFVWMLMLLLGIFFSIIIRKHLVIALKQSVKDANSLILSNNLLVGVQDRGQLSCHKVVILFLYYEIEGCQKDVARLLQVHAANNLNIGVSKAVNTLIKESKISITDSSNRLSDENALQLAMQLILDYSQQYVKAYMKKQLLFPTRPLEGVSDFRPKHCAKSYCICQFIENEYFNRSVKHPWYENLK